VAIRVMAFATILGASSAGLAAQVPVTTPAATSPAATMSAVPIDATMKVPVEQLQLALIAAVRHAAEKLAAQINALAPQLPLWTGTAKAHGIPIEHTGIVFDVEIPGVNGSSIVLYRQMQGPPTFNGAVPPASSQNGVTPVAGTAAAPPGSDLERIQEIQSSRVFQDPTSVYRELVANEIVDAMLDNSAGVPLKADESLIVSTRGVDGVSSPGVLIFSLTQQTLAEYHAGKITRDAARKAVQVKLF